MSLFFIFLLHFRRPPTRNSNSLVQFYDVSRRHQGDRCPIPQALPQRGDTVAGIFPRGQSLQDPLRFKANQINELIFKYADGEKVVYMDFGAKFLEPDGSISKEIMPDFLHPTPKDMPSGRTRYSR